MIEAIKIDDKKTASALIQAGLDPNTERSDGELDIPEGSRLLHWAAHFNSSKCAEVRLLSSVVWLDAVHQVLREAMRNGFSAQVLLEGGSDADAVDSIGMAALHFASRFGYLDVVKVTSRAVLFLCLTVHSIGFPEAQCERGGFRHEQIYPTHYCGR